MKEEEEVLGEEVAEEEEVEEEKPKKKKGGGEYELVLNIEDLAVKEALSDVLAVNEEIPKGPAVKSQELRELIDFKEECDALKSLIKPYVKNGKFDILSDEFDLKKAMEMAKEMIGIDGQGEEFIEGEPSPYVQELFRKLWQKYVDCMWFEAMMKGKKPVTPKELKYAPPPEDLIKASGEKI